ncbi:MAG TPA: DNA ligase D [Burkholderiaceae bacterium]|nr:DNA ligase D [Burkholderiaceae bacterium]
MPRLPAPPLELYRSKRDFAVTPEPSGDAAARDGERAYVIQKHAATRLHYDLRLEHGGVMWSWAVPKGPSYDPADKRIALRTEDHPIAYNSFEGTIPKGHYGAGTVIIWDRGHWEPVGDPEEGIAQGKLLFSVHGQKLHGQWELVRIKPKDGERGDPWILFKKRDAYARPHGDYDVVRALPDSVGPAPPPGPATARGGRRKAAARTAAGVMLPDGAVPAAIPASVAPQLATQASGLPPNGQWVFEIKFDGYRMLARFDASGEPRLFTRNGHDWSSKMPSLTGELKALKLKDSWLDGEVVVLGPDGLPDFNALQNAFDGKATREIRYFVFDVPYFAGQDLRAVPLRERRALLEEFLAPRASDHLRFSSAFDADPDHLMRSAEELELEGVIAKRADAPYTSRRTDTWLKLKTQQRQEFVIAGFTDRGGDADAPEIGSLLLGVYGDKGQLVSVGNVGTGWSGETAAKLKQRLLKLEIEQTPFASARTGNKRWVRRTGVVERWVKPQLVAEVSFGGWTPDGSIRHAKYIGLRTDKPAKQVTREQVATPAGALPLKRAASKTKITHPERVIDPASKATKLDLVRYYESVADWLLPHLKGRPCSLVRGPDGVTGELFFQKHLGKVKLAGVKTLDRKLWPEHEALLEVATAQGIVSAAQMNTIEFHTWNCMTRTIDKPDRIVFDLDPGEGVAWPRVQEAAALVHSFLQELGLQAWLKTSGGKGLHVVVPLAPRLDWDTVKGFSQAVVEHMAQVVPNRFTAKSGAHNRVGKIFIDHIRNAHGATTAAAYSARARPGLGVSMPVAWEQLNALKSGAQWTIANAREHLSFQKTDPWAGYWSARQPLGKAMKRLGYNSSEPV